MDTLVEVKNLNSFYIKEYSFEEILSGKKKDLIKILDDLSLSIYNNETLGLVGESGCGKTTFAKCIFRMVDNVKGSIVYDKNNILSLKHSELRELRKKMQMIFQNPYSSLNHNMKIFDIIAEGVKLSDGNSKKADMGKKVLTLCKKVNFKKEKLNYFPHQISGGERRRVGIARILAVNPIFLVADEPVASLDSSIKSQIINLLLEIKELYKMTYLIISHDIGLIKYMCNRIAVMYLGKVVEIGKNKDFRVDRCFHPYTKELLSASNYISSILEMNGLNSDTVVKRRTSSLSYEHDQGCKYRSRCVLYRKIEENKKMICKEREPEIQILDDKFYENHSLACHFALDEYLNKQKG